MPSKFGGVAVASTSKFGGLLIDEEEVAAPELAQPDYEMGIPGFAESAVTPEGQYVEPPVLQLEPTMGEQAIGVGETALTMATGATAGMGGQVRGTLLQLAEEIQSGKFGTADAAQRIKQAAEQLGAEYTYQPRTEQGQQMTQAAGEFAGRYLAPLAGATGELAAAGQAARLAGPIAPATGAAAASATGAVRRGAEAVAESPVGQVAGAVKRAVEAPGIRRDAPSVELAKAQPYNVANAPVMVKGPPGAERIVRDNLAEAAIKQGWQPGVIAAMKAGTDLDRTKALQMVQRYKAGQRDEMLRATRRPTDIIGQSVDERVKFLVDTKKKSGAEIDRIAKETMIRKPVAYEPAMTKFETSLNDIGVTLNRNNEGNLVAVLRGSDIEGDRAAQALLNRILARFDNTDVPDAYKVHLAKRFIDTQVQYGKSKANPLTKQAERVVKGLRRDLNTALGEAFPAYKAANERYSDSIGALGDLQKGVGTSIDLDGDNVASALGTASRKLTSNYATRVNLMDALELLDQVAKKHGMKINDSVINQVIMANEIDRMFGATADTSLKGIMQQVERGVDIARSDALTAALAIAKEGSNKFRGINEANALKAIEELLRRKMETQEPNTLPVAPE